MFTNHQALVTFSPFLESLMRLRALQFQVHVLLEHMNNICTESSPFQKEILRSHHNYDIFLLLSPYNLCLSTSLVLLVSNLLQRTVIDSVGSDILRFSFLSLFPRFSKASNLKRGCCFRVASLHKRRP